MRERKKTSLKQLCKTNDMRWKRQCCVGSKAITQASDEVQRGGHSWDRHGEHVSKTKKLLFVIVAGFQRHLFWKVTYRDPLFYAYIYA